MRGVFSSGKSTRAKELAGEIGRIIEVDTFYYKRNEDGVNDFSISDVRKAQKHAYRELKRAMKSGIYPIIIDRDNRPDRYTKKMMHRVIRSGYIPKLAEPTSELWKDLRIMLENKNSDDTSCFEEIAHQLYILNQETHKVSFEGILKRIMTWPVNVTIDDFLNFDESELYKTKKSAGKYDP
jgi:hypothetical protein